MNISEPRVAPRSPLLVRRPDDTDTGMARPRAVSPTRIVFLINSLVGGGAERVFSTLVNCIQTHIEATEISVVLLDIEAVRFDIDAGISVTCLDCDGKLLQSAWKFGRYVAAHRPHLVVSFLPRANYVASAFAALYGYRCIISERADTRGRIGTGVSSAVEKRLVRLLYPRSNRVIAVAEGVRRNLIKHFGVAPESACTIHNPLDLANIHQQARQPYPPALELEQRAPHGFILAAGRLVKLKRFDVLIQSYAQGNFDVPLVILGEGPELNALQALARSLGVSERVLFPGFLSNPYAVMARATAFVLSSDREGFPNVLVEAMALGRPVIAANCEHGPAEILDATVAPDIKGVHHAKYGLLVPVGDVEALTAALREVHTNPALHASLVERAVERAGHFTVAAAMASYAAQINEQLALVSREYE